MNKIFSIIIPVFNCSYLIEKTLDSIVSQNKDLFECIIVDGKSNDDTSDIILKYKNKYPENIRYISELDKGIYDAMNKGIDLSEGQYLYFIGAGDTLHGGILEKIKQKLNFELEIVHGKVFINNRNQTQGRYFDKKDIINFIMPHQGIFYNKKVFDVLGKYDLKYPISSDLEYNIRLFSSDSIKKNYVDVVIANYLGDGISDERLDTVFWKDYKNVIYKYIGKIFVKDTFVNLLNIKDINKKIIGWSASNGYLSIKNRDSLNLDCFVDVDLKKHGCTINNFEIYPIDLILPEDKGRTYILVFSHTYYDDISNQLKSLGFNEYEDYCFCSERLLDLIEFS